MNNVWNKLTLRRTAKPVVSPDPKQPTTVLVSVE